MPLFCHPVHFIPVTVSRDNKSAASVESFIAFGGLIY